MSRYVRTQRYFKFVHQPGPHGLMITTAQDPRVQRWIESYREVGQEVQEIDGNEARTVLAERRRHNEKQQEVQE